MLINEELRKHLAADTIIQGIVHGRIFADAIPPTEKRMPAIVYVFIDGVSSSTLAGTLDHARARVQVDAISDFRNGSMQLAERIRLLLDGHRGAMQGAWCQGIELESGFRFEMEEREDDKRRFITSQDFGIHYQQATS